ncbi:hypothetical protein [Sulfurimonas sp.]|uniref:hypothetical protein n=1 Tax=Sulfurimonas sp. TaxID=2022749 RepID=UPI0035648897
MRTETAIDTIALQCNFYDEEKCDTARYEIIERLKAYRLYSGGEEYKLYSDDGITFEYKFKTVVTIDSGSYSYVKKDKKKARPEWYLSIKLAGLKRYIPDRDKVSHNALMLLVSYLNTHKIAFKVTQFDVALNIFTKLENVLALCTRRYATTQYWKANEEQLFPTTRYMEKFRNAKHKAEAVSHCCLYGKSQKEGLEYKLTRLEVSFQKKFFKNNGFNVGTMYNEFHRYHVMYIPNQKKKQEIMDKYDSLEVLRKKDIKDLKLEKYRLHIDVNVLVDFATKLYLVDDGVLEQFML